MKKLYALSLPLLAVAAFAIAPATASAITSYGTCAPGAASANCPAGNKFTEFAEFEHVGVFARNVSATFVLENVAKTADIECSSLEGIGYVRNVTKKGQSIITLAFDGCKGSGLLKECKINSKNNEEIEGTVDDEVLKEETVKKLYEVKITISEGFNVKCLKGGVEEELGNVTGSATGTQNEKTNVLKFSKATGLKFGSGEEATITGEDEISTLQGKKVYI